MNTNVEKLNDQLYDKLSAEQETYRGWLLSQSPEEILNHTYEYTMREDILMSVETNNLTAPQAEALLASPDALSALFHAFADIETDHMDIVRNCVVNHANDLLRQRAELSNTPVYLESGEYAREHGELEMYRASYKANISCKEALTEAIRENYTGNRLNTALIYDNAVERFGPERVKLVLAATIRHKDWDERFSRDNRAWAQTVPMEVCFGSRGNDHSVHYVVDSHSSLTDLFVSHFRREQEKEQPKKQSVLSKLQKPLPEQKPKTDRTVNHER